MTDARRLSEVRTRALSTLHANNPLRRWLPSAQADPSAQMFAGIRLRMTLLYTGILAVILVFAGALLYVGMQRVLLAPVISQLQNEAAVDETRSWQQTGTAIGCALPPDQYRLPYAFIACFDTNGNLLGFNQQGSLLTSLVSTSLAKQALTSGSSGTATDITTSVVRQSFQQGEQGGPGPGTSTTAQTATIYRYAAVVHNGTGQTTLGVVEVGWDITGEAQALHTLLTLLLIVGGITLVACGVGGALLAGRTLAPARLALARQQAFIADAGHEMRTPLALLRASAEVLLRGRQNLPPEDAALLDDMVGDVAQMGALAENLLALARLDAGAVHPEQEVVNLGEVASSIVRRAHALADERQIVLTVERGDEPLVIGDPTQLSEVALILVDNAIKYNRPGGTVTVRTLRDDGHAVLEVRDTGIGIAPEHLSHLGERFYRIDKARSRQMGGAGLGISIARRIAALHHGTLTLTSEPGKGTTATLRLPSAG